MELETFLTIDVETASDDSSICQIGIARFENGIVTKKWSTFINPETQLFVNTIIHNIDYDMVSDAPTFEHIYPTIKEMTEGMIVIHHMPFVKLSLNLACDKYHLPHLEFEQWLDSAKILRRTYFEFSKSGYGLFNAASLLYIPTGEYHDALQDAIIAGEITIECTKKRECTLADWFSITKESITPHTNTKFAREGDPDGILYGETIVFTGKLSLPREEAATLASRAGCTVKDSVTKDTTILVVGIPNLAVLKDQEKSSKQKRAEKLISEGQQIKIMYEQNFVDLLKIV